MSKSPLFVLLLSTSLIFAACESQDASESSDAPSEAAVAEETEEAPSTDEADNANEADQEQAEAPELPDDMSPDETRHFGAPFESDEAPVTLSELLDLASMDEAYTSERPILVSAEIEQVCQSKGCWFTLTTDEVDIPVRVRMLDYGFFVPRNTAGAEVLVEGIFEKTTISQEMAQHYADDAAKESGEEPEQVDGPQETYEFTASGIEITLPAT